MLQEKVRLVRSREVSAGCMHTKKEVGIRTLGEAFPLSRALCAEWRGSSD
jgi:hypothetical protein